MLRFCYLSFLAVLLLTNSVAAGEVTITSVKAYRYETLIVDPAARAAQGIVQEIVPDEGAVFVAIELTMQARFVRDDPDRLSIAVKNLRLYYATASGQPVTALSVSDYLGEYRSNWQREIVFTREKKQTRRVVLVYAVTRELEGLELAFNGQRLALKVGEGVGFDPLADVAVTVGKAKVVEGFEQRIGAWRGRPGRVITTAVDSEKGLLIALPLSIIAKRANVDDPVMMSIDDLVLTTGEGVIVRGIGYREGDGYVFSAKRLELAGSNELSVLFRVPVGIGGMKLSYLYQPLGKVGMDDIRRD